MMCQCMFINCNKCQPVSGQRDMDLRGRSREDGREESPHSLPGKSHGANFRNNKIITWETVEDFKGQTFSPSKVYMMSDTDPSGTFF